MTGSEPENPESALGRSGFWHDVASSVASSLITAYIIFAVAGFIGIAALGGAGTSLKWVEAIGFLVLSAVLAGACAHLVWTVYLVWTGWRLMHRERPAVTRTVPWILACVASVGALFVPVLFVNQDWTLGILLFLAVFLLGMTSWSAKRQVKWNVGVFVAWVAVNVIGALIGFGGMGVVIGSILRRAIASDLG